jgi:hypothetical protein
MSPPKKPVKVVLTASVYLVASSALQGTVTSAAKSDLPQHGIEKTSIVPGKAEAKMRQALLTLSPYEKLKIAGDRIRLSRSNSNNNTNRGGRIYSNPIKPPKPPIPPNTAKPQQKKRK